MEDNVVLITGINSSENNTRIYCLVADLSEYNLLTVYIERTVIE